MVSLLFEQTFRLTKGVKPIFFVNKTSYLGLNIGRISIFSPYSQLILLFFMPLLVNNGFYIILTWKCHLWDT